MTEQQNEPEPAEDDAETRTDPPEGDDPMGGDPAETPDDDQPDVFPREVVERLRRENGKYRQRAQRGDAYAQRLHTELVKATGRLADPSDLEFDEDHLDDPDALTAAIEALIEAKPHLASRRPVGDIGQGNRGSSAQPFSLLGMLKERT